MTTSQVIECHHPILHIERQQPRYSLLVSADRVHREAAQRLRYQVFAQEPGFMIPHNAQGLDADRYDEFCDHILVRENATEEIVGCYRMLPPDAALAAGGYYTATEFDLTALDPAGHRIVEMGRAVVAPAHRSGTVLAMMWSGILTYLELAGHSQVMGAVSVPITTPGLPQAANVRAVRDFTLARHANPADRRVVPRIPVVVGGRALDEITPPPRPQIPPLLRGYLRMGAVVCGEPAHDPEFGVADFFALQDLAGANRRYLDRLRSASSRMDAA